MPTQSDEVTSPRNVVFVGWRQGVYRCEYESHGLERRTITVYFGDEVVYAKSCTDASDAYMRTTQLRAPDSES